MDQRLFFEKTLAETTHSSTTSMMPMNKRQMCAQSNMIAHCSGRFRIRLDPNVSMSDKTPTTSTSSDMVSNICRKNLESTWSASVKRYSMLPQTTTTMRKMDDDSMGFCRMTSPFVYSDAKSWVDMLSGGS